MSLPIDCPKTAKVTSRYFSGRRDFADCYLVSVLVLEFGPFDRSNQTLWPGNAVLINQKDMFNITSAPEPGMAGHTYSVLAGAVPGGGTTVNGMELDRASISDYDFEALGNPGWSWIDLFPYFKKVSRAAYA